MSHVIPLPPCSRRRDARRSSDSPSAQLALAEGATVADRLAAEAETIQAQLIRGDNVLPALATLIDSLGALHCLLEETAHQGALR